MKTVTTGLDLLQIDHLLHYLRSPPTCTRSRVLVGRLQYRAPTRGARCVGVQHSGGLVWPEFLKILWSLDGEVAPEEQAVDGGLRQEGLGLVLFLGVENLVEVKTR